MFVIERRSKSSDTLNECEFWRANNQMLIAGCASSKLRKLMIHRLTRLYQLRIYAGLEKII